METADEVLKQFLKDVDLGVGYKEVDSLTSGSDTWASRTFFGPERRTATFRVIRAESATKALEHARFEFDKRFKWRKQRRLPIEKLEFGDLSYLYQDRYTEWEGAAIKGHWTCYVGRGYKQLWHGATAKEAVTKDLQALYAILPGGEGEVTPPPINVVDVKSDPKCTEELRRLLSTPLAKLSVAELVRVTEVSGAAAQGEFQEQTHSPTPVAFLQQHRAAIIEAARVTQLSPEVVAAAILSEVRGLDSRVFTTPFVEQLTKKIQEKILEKSVENVAWVEQVGLERYIALMAVAQLSVPFVLDGARYVEGWAHTFGITTDEDLRDWALSFYSDDVSIGLGQRQVKSLIDMGVHNHFPELTGLDDEALRKRLRQMLLDSRDNIRLIARFLREMAKRAAGYRGTRQNELANWTARNACGKFDLAVFNRPVAEWTPAHIRFLGWKYNTGHVDNLDDISGTPSWGDMFLNSYKDIVTAQLFGKNK